MHHVTSRELLPPSAAIRRFDDANSSQIYEQNAFASVIEPPISAVSRQIQSQLREYQVVVGIPDRLVAQSLEWTISSLGQLKRVKCICNVDEIVATMSSELPRIIILDEQSACANLQSIARQIPVRLGDCRIAIFADRLSCRQLHMSSVYVHGLLSWKATVPMLMSDLDVIASGRRIVSECLQSRVVLDKRNRFEVLSVEQLQNLTNRQLEVLIRIAQGMTAKEAAQDLHLTEKAVESHKYRLMKLLGVRDRIELCRWAIREGIISK